jgi:hypothetical protein
MEYEVEKAPEPETVEKLPVSEPEIPLVGHFGGVADNLVMWNDLFRDIIQGTAAASHYRLHHTKVIKTHEDANGTLRHTWGNDYEKNGEEIAHCARLADLAYAELVKRSGSRKRDV